MWLFDYVQVSTRRLFHHIYTGGRMSYTGAVCHIRGPYVILPFHHIIRGQKKWTYGAPHSNAEVRIWMRLFCVSPHNVAKKYPIYGPYFWSRTRRVKGQHKLDIRPFNPRIQLYTPPYVSWQPYLGRKWPLTLLGGWYERFSRCQNHNKMVYTLTCQKQYFPRIDPLNLYSETKFVQRYRLGKEVVKVLIKQFVSTKKRKVLRGRHAIPYSLRVSVLLPL